MNKLLLLFCVFILAACNPYAGLATPTPTATATGTAAPATQTATNTPTPALATCTVTTGVQAGNLNIRTGAGVGFAVIKVLQEGQAATITDESPRGNWIQVKTGHVTGWINSKFCKGD